jgi:hypothetical protein
MAFRVMSQGGGAGPVLQIRRAHGERWAVYGQKERSTRSGQRSRSLKRSMEVKRGEGEVEVGNLCETPASCTRGRSAVTRNSRLNPIVTDLQRVMWG